MAYQEAFDNGPAQQDDDYRPTSRVVGWLGAITSVALIGGLGFWAYDLATRDSRGVPIVRALEGPARVAPEAPGGFEAAHQGFSVNNIATDAPEEPLSERIVLAPEATGVAAEDQPVAKPVVVNTTSAPKPEVKPAASEPATLRSAVSSVLGEVLGDTTPEPVEATPAATAPSGTASPRPQRRPSLEIVTRADPGVVLGRALDRAAVAESLDPTLIPAGTRLVQLGAYASPEIAMEEWTRLSGQFDGYLEDKSRVVERAEVGERVFYRLRAHGFDDLAMARNFCAVLMAEQADCIPVLTR